jgi:hypothetical protein
MSNFEQTVARSSATWAELREELNYRSTFQIQCPCRREIVDDDQVTGSPAQAKGAIRKIPSLALALLPRPEVLEAGNCWLASEGDESTADGNVTDAIAGAKERSKE